MNKMTLIERLRVWAYKRKMRKLSFEERLELLKERNKTTEQT